MGAEEPAPARKRKLLVLDLNGFLIDRVRSTGGPKPAAAAPECDLREGGCAVYFRPHMREFIAYCMDDLGFTVGLWTSARSRNVANCLDAVFSTRRGELLFEWDQGACTVAGPLHHPDCAFKPIFLKELSRLWRHGCALGFDPGTTILLDDTVYKTALNPPHSSIHPREWATASDDRAHDNALAADSELRALLAALAAADDVRVVLARATRTFPSLVPDGLQRAARITRIPGLAEYCAARRCRGAPRQNE
ncbi:HAD-like domain-containing protein [Pavlovales sp. CCMP2436]|nr:HAD-like domain-containing protein [Pavlovales sp. CCMP2436]